MNILIYSPEAALGKRLHELLRQEEYTTTVISQSQMIPCYAQTGVFDVILLDGGADESSSLSMARTLRDQHLGTPIVLFHSCVNLDTRVMALQCGVDYLLPNPFEPQELLAFLTLLQRKKHFQDQQLTYGNTLLDLDASSLVCEGQELTLSRKELQILQMLFRTGSHNLSKSAILSRVWDDCASPNNVEVYVGLLRKKLQRISSNVQITSIRGLGYHLECLAE